MAATTARRYAQGIFSVLDRPEAAERVGRDLSSFRRILLELPSMGRTLLHPGVPEARRRELLDGLFEHLDAHPVSRGTLALLIERRELRLLGPLLEALSRLSEEKLNVAAAEVTTARPLGNGERPAWETALARVAGKPVRIQFHTDSSLIGGAVARIGSVLYDGSVRGSLARIRQSLLGE